ncbi:MAG: glycosyltransferase family 2 protein [Gallionella sp.]|jgi:GT2 family glycosyltransferase|nr:glycosyltransferase family 2 protein [Gallionella sp.]
MSARPTVSVCIANYNGLEVIDDCIASVLAQDCMFPIEIIVHDDASTDGSAQYVRDKYPAVRLIESNENVGFCVANNRMAQAAQGEYLLLLNNDAELYPDALSSLHKAASDIGRPAILSLPQYDFETGELLDIGCLVDPFLNPVPNRNPEREEVAMVMGACLWISKSLWLELGGFPEWFGSIGEDLYLCCRARLAGYSVRALGISGYRHRVGGSFGGGKVCQGQLITTRRRRTLSERNKSFVMVLTYPTPIFQCLLPLHLFLLLIEGVALAMLKRDYSLFSDIYLASLKGLWSERGRLVLFRSKLQLGRRMSKWCFFSAFSLLPHKLYLLLKHGIPQIR